MLLKNKRVAIIGGGPGGLTLARLLQQRGAEINVYERDINKNVRQQGATLDLHEDSGLRALKEAGLMAEFKKHYRPGADRMRITDLNAVIQWDDHQENLSEDFGHKTFRPEIDRGPLRDMLIASLNENTIVWDAKFRAMEKAVQGWALFFQNGETAHADVVVAADGANSQLRKHITDIAAIYSGVTIVEGNINNADVNTPRLWDLTKGGKVFALNSHNTIILSAKGDGALSFYTGTKETEDWVKASGINFNDKADIFRWFKKRFIGWSNVWDELFGTDDSYFVPRPQYHFPADQSWKPLPDLTMIGDAAHRMPPYAGEGVNMAMMDALELYYAICDRNGESLAGAIGLFEKQMCMRTAGVTQITLQQTDALHSENNLQYLLDFFNTPFENE